MQEREAMAVLASVQGLSYGRREVALRAAGCAEALLADPGAYAKPLGEAGMAAIVRMIRSGGVERTLDQLALHRVSLAVRGEAGYPGRLMHIPNPPHVLFIRGGASLEDAYPFAVVGTRRATGYGLSMTREIAKELAQAGVCVVSGLAMGVDAAAHQGALDGHGRTIAVLGGGLDRLSPLRNRPLMEDIIDSGGSVISEYPLGMSAAPYNFLHRNRIIAGMSLGVLVTEGEKRSGALCTANNALAFGREVFALPGDVRNANSQLPHMLIQDGAQLITCAQDILNMIRIEHPHQAEANVPPGEAGAKSKAPQGRSMPSGLDAQEQAVWRALEDGECDFDALCSRTGMEPDDLGSLLVMMELDGHVEALPGLAYRLA